MFMTREPRFIYGSVSWVMATVALSLRSIMRRLVSRSTSVKSAKRPKPAEFTSVVTVGRSRSSSAAYSAKAAESRRVERQYPRPRAQRTGQLLEPLAPPGDEPYLVELLLGVHSLGELQPHPRGRARDNRYFHAISILSTYII